MGKAVDQCRAGHGTAEEMRGCILSTHLRHGDGWVGNVEWHSEASSLLHRHPRCRQLSTGL
eukprot:3753580-Rhodomonas_salina.2